MQLRNTYYIEDLVEMSLNNYKFQNLAIIVSLAILASACVKLVYKTSDPTDLKCNIYNILYYSIDNTSGIGREKAPGSLKKALGILSENMCNGTYIADFTRHSLDIFPNAVFPRSKLTFVNGCAHIKQYQTDKTPALIKESSFCLND